MPRLDNNYGFGCLVLFISHVDMTEGGRGFENVHITLHKYVFTILKKVPKEGGIKGFRKLSMRGFIFYRDFKILTDFNQIDSEGINRGK